MMDAIVVVLTRVSDLLWGPPLLVALLGTGTLLTIRLGAVQLRHLPLALRMVFMPPRDKTCPGEITHFQALMTALAATVGTGNIAGVGIAIAMGGPGAMLWMWATGLLGMATKYAEAVLAVRYRVVHDDGTVSGGPMYYIEKGLGHKGWASGFAVCAAVAAFGIGNMIQSNSVAEALNGAFGWPHWITGLVIAITAGLVMLGGIRSIARATQVLVPVMIVTYVGAGLTAILMNLDQVPLVFEAIVTHAFTGQAIYGGITGAGVRQALRRGLASGLLSNESGMGSSPIAAAAARTGHPVTQALVSMTQTFIDTLLVCSITGFVIIISGAGAGGETGSKLTAEAFNTLLGGGSGSLITALGLSLFAFSTILGWSYYGEKAVEYLFGPSSIHPYRRVFVVMVFVGTVLKLEVVWRFSDIMNALMALPNLLALVMLSGEIRRLHREYFGSRSAQSGP